MSRRARVPKRKQLDGKHRRRNVNPKLSPYQKEQKRDRLANQAPVSIQKRDFPASARKLQQFLVGVSERRQRQRSKDEAAAAQFDPTKPPEEWEVEFVPTTFEVPDLQALRTQPAPAPIDDADGYANLASSASTSAASDNDEDDTGSEGSATDIDGARDDVSQVSDVDTEKMPSAAVAKKPTTPRVVLDDDEASIDSDDGPRKRSTRSSVFRRPVAEEASSAGNMTVAPSPSTAGPSGVTSLNAVIRNSLETVDPAMIKRLEKKQLAAQKKREKRRHERIEKLKAKSDALDMLVNKSSAKKLRNDAELRKEVAAAIATASASARRKKTKRHQEDADGDGGETAGDRETGVAPSAATANHQTVIQKRAPVEKDFNDLVDHVRFGERADAPPTFDILPQANAALVPAQHVGKAKRARLLEEARREKVQKAVTGSVDRKGVKLVATPLPDGQELVAPTVKNARLESAEDFAALRERVMARYAAKNQGTFNQRRRNIAFTISGDPSA